MTPDSSYYWEGAGEWGEGTKWDRGQKKENKKKASCMTTGRRCSVLKRAPQKVTCEHTVLRMYV